MESPLHIPLMRVVCELAEVEDEQQADTELRVHSSSPTCRPHQGGSRSSLLCSILSPAEVAHTNEGSKIERHEAHCTSPPASLLDKFSSAPQTFDCSW